ncbi:MAG: hypothetical protein EXS25_03620 [Pedosphaera sp.]|nr:hypothetical protein [Pedosphaera sp.]
MISLEHQILSQLIELEQIVMEMAAGGPRKSLLTWVKKIDELTQLLPTNTDPHLLHYLHKRSYEKARLYLQGRDAETVEGPCAHL